MSLRWIELNGVAPDCLSRNSRKMPLREKREQLRESVFTFSFPEKWCDDRNRLAECWMMFSVRQHLSVSLLSPPPQPLRSSCMINAWRVLLSPHQTRRDTRCISCWGRWKKKKLKCKCERLALACLRVYHFDACVCCKPKRETKYLFIEKPERTRKRFTNWREKRNETRKCEIDCETTANGSTLKKHTKSVNSALCTERIKWFFLHLLLRMMKMTIMSFTCNWKPNKTNIGGLLIHRERAHVTH